MSFEHENLGFWSVILSYTLRYALLNSGPYEILEAQAVEISLIGQKILKKHHFGANAHRQMGKPGREKVAWVYLHLG
jgi:hypothetical protein